MNTEILASLVLFAFLMTCSPGPNNLMLMASGANFGWKRSVPHMTGVVLGFALMIVLVGIGVDGLFQRHPELNLVLRALSIGFLLYLAWHALFHNKGNAKATRPQRPMRFHQAVLFQWVNPKAWTMALTGLSIAAAADELQKLIAVAAVFSLINLCSASAWVCLGGQIVRWLNTERNLLIFNYCVAGGLLLSAVPILLEG